MLAQLANNAGQTAPFLYGIVALVIIATVGGTAHILLQFTDNNKMCRMVDKGSYICILGTMITLGVMVMGSIFSALKQFIQLVLG